MEGQESSSAEASPLPEEAVSSQRAFSSRQESQRELEPQQRSAEESSSLGLGKAGEPPSCSGLPRRRGWREEEEEEGEELSSLPRPAWPAPALLHLLLLL